MRLQQLFRFALMVALVAAVPWTVAAQTTIEVGPLLAVYAPVGAFATPDLYSTNLPTAPSDLGGVAWGGEGRLWFAPRLGVQVQGAVSASHLVGGGMTPIGLLPPKDAHVVTVTAQVLFRPLPKILPAWLSAGVGFVRRGGHAYAGLSALTSLAVALGAGFDLHVAGPLTASFGLTTLLYSLSVQFQPGPGSTIERGFQVDLLPYVSLAWRSRLE